MTFTPYEQKLLDELNAKDREIEVLTQERDNALLRIEELAASVEECTCPFNHHRGGVNPNA